MQQRTHTRLLHDLVGHHLEQLRVERLAVRLRLGLRGAGLPRALLELDAEALGVDVPWWRYQAIVSTPTWVITPPKQP